MKDKETADHRPQNEPNPKNYQPRMILRCGCTWRNNSHDPWALWIRDGVMLVYRLFNMRLDGTSLCVPAHAAHVISGRSAQRIDTRE